MTTTQEPRRCTAIADYVAKGDDEISFVKGDVIFVPKRTNEERWQGVLKGKIGFFPRIYVDDKTVEVSAGTTTRVRALRDYEAAADTELSFPKGAVMFVVGRESDAFWKGVYEGKTGLIPSSHVENATEAEKPKEFDGIKCKAVRSNIPKDATELAFKCGDTVFVPKPDPEQEMWRGVCNSEIGLFPASKVVDTAKHSEEEIQRMVEENAKLSDEEAAKAALEKLEKEKQEKLALAQQQQQQQPEIPATPPSEAAETNTGNAKDSDDAGTEKNADDDDDNDDDDDDDTVAPEGTDAVDEADPYAGMTDKERKAAMKKAEKEAAKKAKEEAKAEKKRAKEEAKRIKLEAKEAKKNKK